MILWNLKDTRENNKVLFIINSLSNGFLMKPIFLSQIFIVFL